LVVRMADSFRSEVVCGLNLVAEGRDRKPFSPSLSRCATVQRSVNSWNQNAAGGLLLLRHVTPLPRRDVVCVVRDYHANSIHILRLHVVATSDGWRAKVGWLKGR
jgi:hypothetical protein